MGAGGLIKVDPEALEALGRRVDRQVQRVAEVAGQALAQADVPTGDPELDAALREFCAQWRPQMEQQHQFGEGFVHSILVSAQVYRRTDATAIPALGGLGGSEEAP